MRDGEHELGAETQVSAHTLREVFRGVTRIIDVPFKLVSNNHLADSNVELDDPDLLKRHCDRGALLTFLYNSAGLEGGVRQS